MSNMNHTIIQWNCRGLKSNYNDLLVLLSKHSPGVVCLQETMLPENDNLTLKNYSLYNYICTSNLRTSGGSTIAVANTVAQSKINLNTTLQAWIYKC